MDVKDVIKMIKAEGYELRPISRLVPQRIRLKGAKQAAAESEFGQIFFQHYQGKSFDLWPERGVKFQVRADAANALNHASFGQPGNNAIGQGESAQITGTTVGGRALQLYGRISF